MSEITKTTDQTPATKTKFVWLALAALTVFVYFFGLNIPLLGPDEPRYSQVAREMFERNDFVTPTLGGFTWFEKPALLYWLQIVSYNLFGVNEFAARFGSAIFGLLTVFSLWLLGRFLGGNSGRNENTQPNADLSKWLFLISATSIGLLAFSRGASFDIILTFPITASLVGFFIFDQSSKDRPGVRYLSLVAFYFFIGVALLAKGLVGIVFPLAIVAFYYLLIRKIPNKTFIFSLFWGTILSVLVAATWYVPVYLANGWTFVDEFFIQHHFARYTSNKYMHPQPFWFFWVVLPLMTLPWLPFFLAAIWKFVKGSFHRRDAGTQRETGKLTTPNSQLTTFAFAWMLVPLFFFSLSGSKLPGYILPALPAALILTADYLTRFVRNDRKRALVLHSVAFVVLAGIAITLQFFFMDLARHETIKPLIAAANARGYSDARILNLHTTSHNAEFYGAKRLARTLDGKLRKFLGAGEVAEDMRQNQGKPVIVLVPLEYVNQLPESGLFSVENLGDNGKLAILAVTLKESERSQ